MNNDNNNVNNNPDAMNMPYYVCNMERTAELSERMAERNIPSTPLAPQFGMRPVSTKYSTMPIFDQQPTTTVPTIPRPAFNVTQTFNPGTAQAPWSGFATNINDESRLRNQFFAMQRCEQAAYIPGTTSDMYHVTVGGRNEVQPFPDLFEEQQFSHMNPNTCNVGYNLFGNCTRQQLMNMSGHNSENMKDDNKDKN